MLVVPELKEESSENVLTMAIVHGFVQLALHFRKFNMIEIYLNNNEKMSII
jgi:hypothetical protein